MPVWDPPRTRRCRNAARTSTSRVLCSGEDTARWPPRCSNPRPRASIPAWVPGQPDPGPSRVHDGGRQRRPISSARPSSSSRPSRKPRPGRTWGVGTEYTSSDALAQDNPDKTIHFLSPMVLYVPTMYRIDPPACGVVPPENLSRETPVNRIKVPAETAQWARMALERMLEVTLSRA